MSETEAEKAAREARERTQAVEQAVRDRIAQFQREAEQRLKDNTEPRQ